MGTENLIEQYLSQPSPEKRLNLLEKMRSNGSTFPIDLVDDLLHLELPKKELNDILELVNRKNPLALEHFLTSRLFYWSQDLSTRAIKLWAEKTPCTLWFRFLPLVNFAGLPQRLKYTILDVSWMAGGRYLVQAILDSEGFEDLSPAFHALLFQRAIEWHLKDESLVKLAQKKTQKVVDFRESDTKDVLGAMLYLNFCDPKKMVALTAKIEPSTPWHFVAKCLGLEESSPRKNIQKLEKFFSKPPKTKAFEKFLEIWPDCYERSALGVEPIVHALEFLHKHQPKKIKQPWQLFTGCDPEAIEQAFLMTNDPALLATALYYLRSILGYDPSEKLLTKLRENMLAGELKFKQPHDEQFYLQLAMPAEKAPWPDYQSKIEESKKDVIQNFRKKSLEHFKSVDESFDEILEERNSPEDRVRNRFFKLAYEHRVAELRGTGVDQSLTSQYWNLMFDSWKDPDPLKLGELATVARKAPHIFQLPYIQTLGRFVGCDEVALKALDFIRHKEEYILRPLIHSLAKSSTTRALQELVASLTRPNFGSSLRIEICQLLAEKDLKKLQHDLRIAYKEIWEAPDRSEESIELHEALSSLLTPITEEVGESIAKVPAQTESKDLDASLSGKIANFKRLSGEVKRAIRTAQFIHDRVLLDQNQAKSIEMSPVIDMQYKGLELLFRELFEKACSDLIHAGTLQRKLDVIGYARPIPPAMEQFENYIASLPVVRNIAFFSKFKLRKMLRAICQYRPGKRFTLDGLKAFGLFFLCFSRSECKYGLAGLFHIGLKTDEELFEFVHLLHTFQDVRNRAAHEGLHADAGNDIDGIWRQTSEIIQKCYVVAEPHLSDSENSHRTAIVRAS